MRQYTRQDIDYSYFYTDYMKMLAKRYTLQQLKTNLIGEEIKINKAVSSHLRAIKKTSSMNSNSQNRAQSRNVASAHSQYISALNGAIEIYELFPEHGKDGGSMQKEQNVL